MIGVSEDMGFEYIHYSQINRLECHKTKRDIYEFLYPLNREYPHFYSWYESLFRADGLLNNDREIIFCKVLNTVVGVIILKKSSEKKICTLRVRWEFQKMGIGSKLVELGFEWLEDDKPLITVANKRSWQFRKIFRYYGFKQEDRKWGYYSLIASECAYNGSLDPRPIFIDTIEVERFKEVIKRTGLFPEKEQLDNVIRELFYEEYPAIY